MLRVVAKRMRDLLPQGVRSRISRVAAFFGGPVFPELRNTLRVLMQRGFRPQFVIDVGAYHGEWTKQFSEIFPESKVLMIEAQEGKRETLTEICAHSGGRYSLAMNLLGPDDASDVVFTEMETGSSVFEESSSFSRRRISRQTTSLDSVLLERGLSGPISFLKLDVQGYELEVLKGAQDALLRTEFVLLEVSLIPINKGCPLVADVVNFMSERGFRLYDFCSQIRRPDLVLWQADFLFVSQQSPLLPESRFWL